MKKLLKYLPFHFLLCLIFGILIQYHYSFWQFGFQNLSIFLVVLIFLLFVSNFLDKKVFFTILMWMFFILVGISTVYFQDVRNSKLYYGLKEKNNFTAVLTIEKVLKPGNYYYKYQAKIYQVNQQKTVGLVLLNIQKDSLQELLKIDEQILLKPNLKDLIPPLNPHQFNYKKYLAKQGIYHQVFIDNKQYKKLDNSKLSLFGMSARFRNKIQKSLKEHHFKDDEYAVINALLLGQRQDISKELLQDYTRAGAIHILAVSGLHIGIILLILNLLFKKLDSTKKGRLLKIILTIVLLWMFAFIAGLSASVVRAVTMFTFVAIGQSFMHKKIVEHSLIASMFLLLLIKPMFLFDVGFQLSYLAVFGIVWVQPILYNLWKPKWIFIDKGWQLFTVSIAAQAGILPISLYYFHQFPGLFILSNLIIIPFLGTILFGGIVVIILSLLDILPQFLADFYSLIISTMNSFVSWISHQEEFLLKELSMSFNLMLVLYVFIFLGILFFVKKSPKSLILWFFSIVIVQFVLIFEDFNKNKKQEFIVFHKSRKSILGERKGVLLNVYHNLDSISIAKEKLMLSYKIGERVSIDYSRNISNVFQFKDKQILVVDSLGVYNVQNLKKPIVLLQNSPKINLKRLIKILQPKEIIVDGSNFKSYINRWKETCRKEKTPFFYTGENGAYIIKD